MGSSQLVLGLAFAILAINATADDAEVKRVNDEIDKLGVELRKAFEDPSSPPTYTPSGTIQSIVIEIEQRQKALSKMLRALKKKYDYLMKDVKEVNDSATSLHVNSLDYLMKNYEKCAKVADIDDKKVGQEAAAEAKPDITQQQAPQTPLHAQPMDTQGMHTAGGTHGGSKQGNGDVNEDESESHSDKKQKAGKKSKSASAVCQCPREKELKKELVSLEKQLNRTKDHVKKKRMMTARYCITRELRHYHHKGRKSGNGNKKGKGRSKH